MNKKIEDYLHLYLGCEVQIESDNFKIGNKKEQIRDILKGITTDGYCICINYSLDINDGIKLLLRPLSNMTDKQKEWYGGRVTFDVMEFKWLLEEHFDIFGLIESDLAIDITKTTHQ